MAGRIEAKFNKLGVTLPVLPQPGGNYLPARTVGKIVYVAGVISILDGEVIGKIVSGRQSQVWVHFDEGRRIVSAHVSVLQ